MNKQKVNLKEMTSRVIADKVFAKAVEDYGENTKRNVLVVTEFDNKSEIIVSNKVAKKLGRNSELVKAIKELFESDHEEE